MNPVRTIEMDCTHAELLRELPVACGMRPYEIIGERLVVHDVAREIQIKISEQPLRHLGSLNLPVEKLTFKFVDYREDEADKFLQDFLRPLERYAESAGIDRRLRRTRQEPRPASRASRPIQLHLTRHPGNPGVMPRQDPDRLKGALFGLGLLVNGQRCLAVRVPAAPVPVGGSVLYMPESWLTRGD